VKINNTGLVRYIKTNGLELGQAVTRTKMGTIMKKLDIVSSAQRSSDRACTLYCISPDTLRKVAENYQVI
jgi:hypothetical protein